MGHNDMSWKAIPATEMLEELPPKWINMVSFLYAFEDPIRNCEKIVPRDFERRVVESPRHSDFIGFFDHRYAAVVQITLRCVVRVWLWRVQVTMREE